MIRRDTARLIIGGVIGCLVGLYTFIIYCKIWPQSSVPEIIPVLWGVFSTSLGIIIAILLDDI